MSPSNQWQPDRQLELRFFKANTNWLLFWSSMVTEDKMREIGTEGVGVLMVLKTFADWKTSKVRISNRELSWRTKLPINRLRKTIDILIENEYIDLYRERPTSVGEYTIYDLVTPVFEDTEEEAAELRIKYQPQAIQRQRDFIKEGLRKGYFPEEQAKSLNINFQYYDQRQIDQRTYNTNQVSPVNNGSGTINIELTNNGTTLQQSAEAAKALLEAQGFKLNKQGLDMLLIGMENAVAEGDKE